VPGQVIPEETCVHEEVYGFLRELEERVLCMKEDDYWWGGYDSGERARNNLYAVSLLASLNGLHERYTQQLEVFLKEAEARYLSNRDYLLPFVLGLYVTFKNSKNKKSSIVGKLIDILLRSQKEAKRPSFGVEYLFSVAFFLDLLESDIEEEAIQKVVTKAKELAISFSKDYETISNDETKVKLLYSLAAIPSASQILKNLYERFKGDIEGLGERVKAEDLKALLIRPYMLLGVPCNRRTAFDLIKYFQENRYGLEEGKIRQRLARFFLYGGNTKRSDIGIQKINSNRYRINFELSKESLLSLQKQIPGISFVCKIALALCNAGFKHVYTIPGYERKEYLEFKKSEEPEKYLRANKKGVDELLEDATNTLYQIMVRNGLVSLVVSITVAIIFAIISQPTLVVIPVLAFLLSQLLVKVPRISEAGYTLIGTLIKKKDHKKRIRQRLEKMLE